MTVTAMTDMTGVYTAQDIQYKYTGQLPYLTSAVICDGEYVKLYKAILYHMHDLGLDINAVLLYGLIAARMTLSYANSAQYTDAEGRVYCLYSRAKIQQILSWDPRKTGKVMKQLKACGLLHTAEVYDDHNILRATRLYLHEWRPSESNDKYPLLTPDTQMSYIVVPFMLITCPAYAGLSLRAKLAYAILLDKLRLAERYCRYDTDGQLYITYRLDAMAEVLDCSERTVTRVYAELEGVGLIRHSQMAYCANWRIFLSDYRDIAGAHCRHSDMPQAAIIDDRQNCISLAQNKDNSVAGTGSPVSPKCDSIYNNYRNNNKESMSYPSAPRIRALPPVASEVEEMILKYSDTQDQPQLLQILGWCEAVLRKDLCDNTEHPYIYNGGGHSYPAADLRASYGGIDPPILFITVIKLAEKWQSIEDHERAVRAYMNKAVEYHHAEAKHFCIVHNLDYHNSTIDACYAALKHL